MLGRSRPGCAIPSIHVFLLSSIAAYTVSPVSACASMLVMIAAPQMLMKTAIVGGLDQPPSIGSFCSTTSAHRSRMAIRLERVRRQSLPDSVEEVRSCRRLVWLIQSGPGDRSGSDDGG